MDKKLNHNDSVLLKFGKIVSSKGIEDKGIMHFQSGLIQGNLEAQESKTEHLDFDLGELIAFPSLINSHDHLLGSYYPRVGPRRPYLSWKPWDDDLKSARVYSERSKISNLDLYYLGAYRHLISGVLTVSDHIPHQVNEAFIEKMPIRVIKNYSLAHEVSNYDLKWGDGIQIEHQRAVERNQPFVTHIEEGFDEESLKGIDYLLAENALTEHTVLVHSLALSNEDIKNIAKRKANVVWCPFSNYFMFHKTCRIKAILEAGINVSLGTDSPMSGSLNLLHEMKFAKCLYRDLYKEEISDELVFNMVTRNAAKAFMLDDLGSLEPGKKADFIAIKKRNDSSTVYKQLVEAELKDIALIFYDGMPLYGDAKYKAIFDYFNKTVESFSVENCSKIIATANPLELLQRVRKAVNFDKQLPFLPID